MKKIIGLFTCCLGIMGVYLAHDWMETDPKPVQYHETISSDIQQKEVPERQEEQQQIQTYSQDQDEQQPEKEEMTRLQQIQNMTQDERAALSQDEKAMYGISDDGRFYTEGDISSEEQIRMNNQR